MPLYRPLYTVGWSNFHLFENLQEPYFCIKEQLAKENSKLEFVQYFFSKMAKTGFDLTKQLNKIRTNFVSGKTFKNVKFKKNIADFGVFQAFWAFLRPCEVKNQQIKVKFWIWGPRKVYYSKPCAQNLFQKSLHPNIQYSGITRQYASCEA